jgi:hypothetical protein
MLSHPTTSKGAIALIVILAIKIGLDFFGIDIPLLDMFTSNNSGGEHPFN